MIQKWPKSGLHIHERSLTNYRAYLGPALLSYSVGTKNGGGGGEIHSIDYFLKLEF